VVTAGIGTAGTVVVTGANVLGLRTMLGEKVGVGDCGAASTRPAVAAGAGVFGLPLVTTAAIADPPQHSRRNVPTIPRINGNLDRFADAGDGGLAYMPERGS
jgi:hypothetical protein